MYYCLFFFFFNDPAPPEIYTPSLHDALPIWQLYAEIASIEEQHVTQYESIIDPDQTWLEQWLIHEATEVYTRSEEHTSELQSRFDLVCRLLLEKKKKKISER